MMKKVELLSPAGSMECLYQAVQNGADAVYLGGKKFGARKYASNFDYNQMVDAIKYCHLYGVKIYVTVNTIIFEEEMEEVLKYVEFLHENNVDALIVQDLTMIKNGNFEDGKTGNGIELGKGTYVTENPYLVMDGTFTTQDQDTAIWIAENDQLMADESSKLMFGNTENSEYKLEIEGNALVVKNSDGTTVTSSNAVLEQIATDETGNETTTPEDPTDTEPEETPQQPAEENPSTSDNIMLFVSLAVISLGLSLVTFRKLCK